MSQPNPAPSGPPVSSLVEHGSGAGVTTLGGATPLASEDAPPRSPASPDLPNHVRTIPIRAIDASFTGGNGNLRALFESIVEWGILQPLIVRPRGARYEVIAGRRRLAAAVAAGMSEVPAFVFTVLDAEAAALAAATNVQPSRSTPAAPSPWPAQLTTVLTELQYSRAAVVGGVALSDRHAHEFRYGISRALIDAELHRMSWMLDALLILTSDRQGRGRPVGVGSLIRAVAGAIQPECRLGEIELRLSVDPPDLAVVGDEAQLRAGLHCLAGAVLTSLHSARHADAGILIRAEAATGAAIITLSQNVLGVHTFASMRGLSRRAEGDHGAALVSVALEATRRVAESHGGRLEFRPQPPEPGCILELKLPAYEEPGGDNGRLDAMTS